MMAMVARSERTLYALALVVAPLLLALATFFWQGSEIGYVAGIIQVYSFIFWIPALWGLLSLLRPTLPTFSVWAGLLVCWVCVAGNNFGLEGIYEASLLRAGVDGAHLAALDQAFLPASILVLYLPGLLFPLTLLVISFLLWRQHAIPPLFALLLGLGALAFPASRITRIELIAHLADLLLLIAAGGIGWWMWQGEGQVQAVAETS